MKRPTASRHAAIARTARWAMLDGIARIAVQLGGDGADEVDRALAVMARELDALRGIHAALAEAGRKEDGRPGGAAP